MLSAWGLVKQVEVRLGHRAGEVMEGWRLNSTCLRWSPVDPDAPPQDRYRSGCVSSVPNSGRCGPANRYFRHLYTLNDDLATLIAFEGRPFLQTLLAREHAAQVDPIERGKREGLPH